MVFTAGTFFNLLLCLIWKSEAPYNLMVQLLATDGALAGLAVRTTKEHFRLSAIHAYFVPLAIMSVVPVAIAACTVELEYIHGLSFDALVAVNAARDAVHLKPQSVDEHGHSRGGTPSVHVQAATETVDEIYARGISNFKAFEASKYDKNRRPTTAEREHREKVIKGKAMLPMVACILFLLHVLAWVGTFTYVFAGFDNASQDNCLDELPIRQYKIILSATTAAFFFIAVIFWSAFVGGLTITHRKAGTYRKDTLEYFASLTHWRGFIDAVSPVVGGWGWSRESVRWSLCFGIYLVWLGIYVSIYITMLQKFLLLGDNPLDWGQVNALGNVFIPLCVVARAIFDNRDGWRRGDATREAAVKFLLLKSSVDDFNAKNAAKVTAAETAAKEDARAKAARRHSAQHETGSLDIDFSRIGSSSRRSSLRSTKRRARRARKEGRDSTPSPSSHRRVSAAGDAGGLEEDLIDDDDGGASPPARPRHTSRRDPSPSSPRSSTPSPLSSSLSSWHLPADEHVGRGPSLRASRRPSSPTSPLTTRKVGRLAPSRSRRHRRGSSGDEGTAEEEGAQRPSGR
ncbi:hypothetical protein DMC30DRAFT_296476 [Rhodotorula diobovata]|uniref:Uncharacterized protein n=1 Tax=Rhodotorula diobovata TaxID=5288 RepID=A0A5C5G734_9BASI|nr:hypothetical protein DMC30DRAFT_296476 [Rhodotorula diobovata]